MKTPLLVPSFALASLALLASSCSTVTLTVAADDGTATAEDAPVVRKRPAGEGNPYSAGRGDDGHDGRESERHDDDDDDHDDDDDDDDEARERRRVIEVHGPLRLNIPQGRVQRLILRQTDRGAFIEPGPQERRAPRIL